MALKSLRKFLLIWWFTVRSFRLLSSGYFVCETGKLLWSWSHSYLPGEVLPVILGGGVPPSSPNLDPTFRPKKAIVYTRFQLAPKIHTLSRPGLQEIMSSLLRLGRKQKKRLLKIHLIRTFLSLSYSVWNWNNKQGHPTRICFKTI